MIRRGVDLAKSAFYFASRGAERILPPIALWYLLWPLNEALAVRYAWRSRERVPASRLPLPADSKHPPLLKRWRHFRRAQTHWWLLGWIDRLPRPKWRSRLQVHGLEKLTTVMAERPVIVCSLHTTSVLTLAAWLRSLGIPAAHVAMDMTWFSNPARIRKQALAKKMGTGFVLRPDRPREMIEFVKSGNALVLTADFTGGRVTHVPWRGGSVTVATGMFRLARTTGAAVVPVLVFATGRWRYEVTIFDPVPHDVIEAGDTEAAARYVVDCLIPPAAARPDQAMAVLAETITETPSATSR